MTYGLLARTKYFGHSTGEHRAFQEHEQEQEHNQDPLPNPIIGIPSQVPKSLGDIVPFDGFAKLKEHPGFFGIGRQSHLF